MKSVVIDFVDGICELGGMKNCTNGKHSLVGSVICVFFPDCGDSVCNSLHNDLNNRTVPRVL